MLARPVFLISAARELYSVVVSTDSGLPALVRLSLDNITVKPCGLTTQK